MGKFIDLTGQKFGRLTVIERAEDHIQPNGKRVIQWFCLCDCGNKTVVQGLALRGNTVVSCGCYGKEQRKKAITKHNLSNTRLFRIWDHVKQRCYNENTDHYKDYGGRGIKVCDDWLDKENGFINFYKWAIANGYDKSLTIDRIDVNGNYEPSNCRWATRKTQMNNRRCNNFITYNDITKTLGQWSEELSIGYKTLEYRTKVGWNLERAFTKV